MVYSGIPNRTAEWNCSGISGIGGRFMKQTGRCPKCGSENLFKDVRVFSLALNGAKDDCNVEVYEDPEAFVFKKSHRGFLKGYVCGGCGFTEFYVSNPADLQIPS
jgi:predicted nucleic-acid-binding Zn-ribbon protein